MRIGVGMEPAALGASGICDVAGVGPGATSVMPTGDQNEEKSVEWT
jgi:hypothetical protein